MSRLRITCKGDAVERGAVLNAVCPSWPDVELTLIDDDGRETPITNVEAVRFEIAAGAEPARAVLTFIDVELDAEIHVDSSFVEQIAAGEEIAAPARPGLAKAGDP